MFDGALISQRKCKSHAKINSHNINVISWGLSADVIRKRYTFILHPEVSGFFHREQQGAETNHTCLWIQKERELKNQKVNSKR